MGEQAVFITGGNSGIGLATALAFADQAVNVAIFSRRADLNEKAKSLIEAKDVKCLTFTGDVKRESDIAAAVNDTFSAFGSLDYAVNNAGVEQVMTPLPEQTEEDYQHIMDINVKGVWLCMKHEIPVMLQSGGGSIVNTASIAGIIGVPQIPIYIASKHAVIGLTKAISLEYAKKNIRINAICPAVVETDLYQRLVKDDQEMHTGIVSLHPMGRTGTCEEVASGVMWLSREATWTTGQTLILDGGYTAQ